MESDLLELNLHYFQRIEEFVRRLREEKFSSIQDLWQIELDLAQFLVGLQEAIAKERASQKEIREQTAVISSTKPMNWQTILQGLQKDFKQIGYRIEIHDRAYHSARRFGDTFAWLVSHKHSDKLIPLTKNHKIPTTSGHGLLGMQTIAQAFSAAGAGFPILHDITHSLRIGDITFITPEADPITIEVKTHLVREDENGKLLDIEVHTVTEVDRWNAINAQIPLSLTVPNDAGVGALPPFKSRKQLDSRFLRQIERMREAKTWQTAPFNQIFQVGGELGIRHNIASEKNLFHWEEACEVVQRAKKEGFAACSVDDAFVYAAIYTDSPSVPGVRKFDLPFAEKIPSFLASSPLWYPEPEKNRPWFGLSLALLTGEGPTHVLPLFLYPFPVDLIIDMLYRRLHLCVFVNLGKIVTAIQAVGLEASLPSSEEEFHRTFLPVASKTALPNGEFLRVELHGLHYYGAKILYEFLSLEGFVEFVRSMAATLLGQEEELKKLTSTRLKSN